MLCTHGTTWCILLKIKLVTKLNGISPSKITIPLLTCVAKHFICVERNIGVNQNYTELNSVNIAGKIEYQFLC
jgi:hypothetical protein